MAVLDTGHQKNIFLYLGCTQGWPKNPTLYFLLHVQALYNEWSKIHAWKNFHAQNKEVCFYAIKFGPFQAFFRHASTCQMLVSMMLNFENSGLQTFPTRIFTIEDCFWLPTLKTVCSRITPREVERGCSIIGGLKEETTAARVIILATWTASLTLPIICHSNLPWPTEIPLMSTAILTANSNVMCTHATATPNKSVTTTPTPSCRSPPA